MVVRKGCDGLMIAETLAQNATGWTQLLDGNILGAAVAMFNGAMGGLFIFALFMIFQTLLYMKTKNWTIVWVTSVISIPIVYKWMPQWSLAFISLLLTVSLAYMVYFAFIKSRD